ncbi:MAG: zinc ribbon domain-containing protein [Chloroflexia bacterium]|nr:zinc ribbon domain-containing protein [Chloroflexia bacterium]
MAIDPAQYCPRCGAHSVPGSRFCAACGSQLGSVPTNESWEISLATSGTGTPVPFPAPRMNRPLRTRLFPIVVFATILLLVAGTGAFLGLPAFREAIGFRLDSMIGRDDDNGDPVHANRVANGSPTPRSTVEADRQNAAPEGSPNSSTVRSCDGAEEYAEALIAWDASLEADLVVCQSSYAG